MSTILKSAAMSLLSKTLQTFLSKYLSDVDVEGVALPSVYDGSGWGVRLSNVKLREGVQLMEETPGKPIRTRKRKQKKKKKQKIPKPEQGKRESDDLDHLSRDAEAELELVSRKIISEQLGKPQLRAPNEKLSDELTSDSLHQRDLKPSRSRISSYDELELSVHIQNEKTDFDEEDYYPSRPSTPVQSSKSIFSCFTKGRKDVNQTNENDTQETTEDTNLNKPPILLVEENDLSRQVSCLEVIDDEKTERQDMFEEESVMECEKNDANEDEDEDEFEDFEQPYRLCIGNNGQIGTLDIRLVDKELHVLVEDAILSIECYPVTRNADESEELEEQGDRSVKTTSVDLNPKKNKDEDVPPLPIKPKIHAETKRETVGDRVLADNPLAKAIARIPHLFLRDVKIRLVIRNEPMEPTSSNDNISKKNEENISQHLPCNEPGPEDTMLEIGIDYLTVNSGEDVLTAFQELPEEDLKKSAETQKHSSNSKSLAGSSSNIEAKVDSNEYMVRHIRTGKGADAGIWIQLFAPSQRLPKRMRSCNASSDLVWARQHWNQNTNFYLLRCSGLDARARIHLGTRKTVSSYSWFFEYDEEYADYDYDDADIDAMMIGFDSIAPGMASLPPATPKMSRGDTPIKTSSSFATQDTADSYEAEPAMHPGSEKFVLDDKNIQSCKIPTTFHRISRGLRPASCKACTHLPSDNCDMCWNGSPSIPKSTKLDDSMPLPGLALQINFRDSLEINVDRGSVDALHLLNGIFVKRPTEGISNVKSETKEKDTEEKDEITKPLKSTTSEAASTKRGFFSYFSSSGNEIEEDKDPMKSFGTEMQPENLQVLGLHLGKIQFRIHVLREDGIDGGSSFCYWDLIASCLTLDLQTLLSRRIVSQDLRFDVGAFSWNELRGVAKRKLLDLGISLDTNLSAISTSKSLLEDHSGNRTPWPSAACALMDIAPPKETLVYKNRDKHGVQLRYISVKDLRSAKDVASSCLNVHVGAAIIDIPWGFWRQVNTTKQQILTRIVGKPASHANKRANNFSEAKQKSRTQSTMSYSLYASGGSMVLSPMLTISAPPTNFSGDISSDCGVSFEAVLDHLSVQYGKIPPRGPKGLTVNQLALLPESVRTRILFCIDDWSALEQALELKKEANPLRRTIAINKAIIRLADNNTSNPMLVGTIDESKSKAESETRQKMIKKLNSLNDTELKLLLDLHEQSSNDTANSSSNRIEI